MKKVCKRNRDGGSFKKKIKLKDIPVREPKDVVNPKYLASPEPEIIKTYKENTPFSFVALRDFADEKLALEALEELKKEKWYSKRNDLYTFKQTNDLKKTTKPALISFREALYSQAFRDYLRGVTGIELNATVDLAGQLYRQGCNLLCHDDELDGRRVAFIWYLVPKDWSEADGGQFCLFANDDGLPSLEPVNKFVPCWNTVLFFETTPTTWHQVSEVLTKKDRYSISGWFHGEVLERPPHLPETVPPPIPSSDFPTGFNLGDWIDAKYLEKGSQQTIRRHFERHSSIGLNDFLIPDKYNQILAELEKSEWKTVGPPTRRHYDTLGRGKSEREVGEVLNLKTLLRSKEMLSFIETITGVTINGSGEGEVRRFKSQDYTLVHDKEHQHQSFGLDLYLHFQDPNGLWDTEHGGFITYMDSETELIALPPQPNVLSLVYRDVGCWNFVKFLTSEAPTHCYDFQNTFTTLDDNNNDSPSADSDGEENGSNEEGGEGEVVGETDTQTDDQ